MVTCAQCSYVKYAGQGKGKGKAQEKDEHDFLPCGRCSKVYYCNLACQRQHYPTHQVECCKGENYILQVGLVPIYTVDGRARLTRRLSIPASTAFYELSRIIQVAFGWPENDDYCFADEIDGKMITHLDNSQPRARTTNIMHNLSRDTKVGFTGYKPGDTTLEDHLGNRAEREGLWYCYDTDGPIPWDVEIMYRGRDAPTETAQVSSFYPTVDAYT